VHHAAAPITTLHQGTYLVVSVHTALDDTEMARFRRELGEAIGDHKARRILIDVAAVDVLDSFGSRTICDVAEVARLCGATAIVVGIEPHLALAMVQLGIDTAAIPTALDLGDGLDAVHDGRQSGAHVPSPPNPRAGNRAQ
jgi:rsbT antagonist protein RsbS